MGTSRMVRVSRSSRLRAIGVVACLALLTGQVAAWVHHSTTLHTVCADHGEWVDRAAVPGAAAVSDTDVTAGTLATASGVPSEVSGDDHCALAALLNRGRNTTAAVATGPIGILALVAVVAPSVSDEALAPARDVRLLAAPKTSPPRA